jgi:hypothetical protein
MIDHVANRASLVEALRRELVGPSPAGPEFDTSKDVRITDRDQLYGPWRESGTGEEILVRDSPTKRYGVGVLYPWKAPVEDPPDGEQGDEEENGLSPDAEVEPPEIPQAEAEPEDFDLSLANSYQPSSVGVSFLAEIPEDASLRIRAGGGRYRKVVVTSALPEAEERKRNWWVRSAVGLDVCISGALLKTSRAEPIRVGQDAERSGVEVEAANCVGLDLRVEVVSRPYGAGRWLLTVCLVNRTTGVESVSEGCLFQTRFSATIQSEKGACILPYPGPRSLGTEEEALALLYRRSQMFATGHGCSADWSAKNGDDRTNSVHAECLPAVETPTVTPDLRRKDGTPLTVSMKTLAGLTPADDGFAALGEIITLYKEWIEERRDEAKSLASTYHAAAKNHLAQCEEAARRMESGLTFLRGDSQARRAFRLANHAILLQQVLREDPRETTLQSGLFAFPEAYSAPDVERPPAGRGEWRAFQMAFLLTSLRSTVDASAPDRETVELIWFPTGGGKTEAYLALAAFAMFMRRLRDQADTGVDVLMRYTLRLLTSQQFERASRLICAMEYLRRRQPDLGETPFSAGIWLGGETTPNTRKDACAALRDLIRYRRADNAFVLTRCPWCAAEFKRIEVPARSKAKPEVFTPGYELVRDTERNENTVILRCPDRLCEFSDELPIYVIDEDIYERRPSLVIGTIDKFAGLAWRPKARALFGIDESGNREASPPGLIIQDELHLIAGPLGSMAGLYETVIEELCTDRRSNPPIPPKIVTSTATIRRSAEQVRGLYARSKLALFPPPGLDASDSFFARHDTEAAGRVYVGVHAVSLGSVQTEWVRTFTALLQAPMPWTPEARDPWWTMVVFFNSIREMGTAHTLLQSDVPDYADVLWGREGTTRENRRYISPSRTFELTGGLPRGEIIGAIDALKTGCTDRGTPKDVCMASNIIEVGIDIQRLSLMVVAGQPKTTSQYIQVTGRVGRKRDRPGLVVTMYSPSKPRDRSHFERFRSYHERLYAHVEPTSVTPFSAPALTRALHAVMVAYCRQTASADLQPFPYCEDLIERLRPLVEARVRLVDPAEEETLAKEFSRRAKQWKNWKRTRWQGSPNGEEIPLLRVAGEYARPEALGMSWPTPTSMRNVDADCEAQVTTKYLEGTDA